MDGEMTPETRRLWLKNEIEYWSKSALFSSGIMCGLALSLLANLSRHATRIIAVTLLIAAAVNIFFDWAWRSSIQDAIKETEKPFQ